PLCVGSQTITVHQCGGEMHGDTVNYFMWRYQVNFCGNAEHEAERLLSRVDPCFEDRKPKVYLVGRQIERRDGFHAICTAPDECPYQPDAFTGLDERLRGLAVDLVVDGHYAVRSRFLVGRSVVGEAVHFVAQNVP